MTPLTSVTSVNSSSGNKNRTSRFFTRMRHQFATAYKTGLRPSFNSFCCASSVIMHSVCKNAVSYTDAYTPSTPNPTPAQHTHAPSKDCSGGICITITCACLQVRELPALFYLTNFNHIFRFVFSSNNTFCFRPTESLIFAAGQPGTL